MKRSQWIPSGAMALAMLALAAAPAGPRAAATAAAVRRGNPAGWDGEAAGGGTRVTLHLGAEPRPATAEAR